MTHQVNTQKTDRKMVIMMDGEAKFENGLWFTENLIMNIDSKKKSKIINLHNDYHSKLKYIDPMFYENNKFLLYQNLSLQQLNSTAYNLFNKYKLKDVHDFILDLKNKNYYFGIINPIPQFIMKNVIKDIFLLDFYTGSEIEFENDICTGQLLKLTNKAQAIQEKIQEYNINPENVILVATLDIYNFASIDQVLKNNGIFVNLNPNIGGNLSQVKQTINNIEQYRIKTDFYKKLKELRNSQIIRDAATILDNITKFTPATLTQKKTSSAQNMMKEIYQKLKKIDSSFNKNINSIENWIGSKEAPIKLTHNNLTNTTKIQLEELINYTSRKFQPSIILKNLDLIFQQPKEKLKKINFNKFKLQAIIDIIIETAIKYTLNNGIIMVSCLQQNNKTYVSLKISTQTIFTYSISIEIS